MVTYHDETVYGRRCEEAKYLRFEYLRCFVEDSHIEVLEFQQRGMAVHRGHGADKDAGLPYLLHHLLTVGEGGYDVTEQVRLMLRCTGEFAAQTDVVGSN